MERFLIHFEIDGYEDSFYVEGETLEETKEAVAYGMKTRGLDADKNNCWSEKVDG